MAEINDLNVTDASNIGRWPEGMAPSAVNNAGRADEGILARWHEDTNGSVASTGSANAYVMAAKQTFLAYYDGLTLTFDANFTNTGAATLNVDAVSADAIVWPDQVALVAGDIVSGAKVTVRHDGTSWQLVNRSSPVMEMGTEVATTSGTSADFTGIRAGVKRITLMFDGVSIDDGSSLLLRVGDSGGIETTGYSSAGSRIQSSAVSTSTSTAGFLIKTDSASAVTSGSIVLTLQDSANNTWVASGSMASPATTDIFVTAGTKSLSAVLDRASVTTSGGTANFDAGAINILVE